MHQLQMLSIHALACSPYLFLPRTPYCLHLVHNVPASSLYYLHLRSPRMTYRPNVNMFRDTGKRTFTNAWSFYCFHILIFIPNCSIICFVMKVKAQTCQWFESQIKENWSFISQKSLFILVKVPNGMKASKDSLVCIIVCSSAQINA